MANKDCYLCGRGTGICQACRHQYLADAESKPEFVAHFQDEAVIAQSIPPSWAFSSEELATSKENIEKAKKDGFEVMYSTPTTLLLDLDTMAAWDHFEDVIPRVAKTFGVEKALWWKSKSNKTYKRHAVVFLKEPLPREVRLALQPILGSDPRRAIHDIRKAAADGCEESSVLFIPPNTTKHEFAFFEEDDKPSRY